VENYLKKISRSLIARLEAGAKLPESGVISDEWLIDGCLSNAWMINSELSEMGRFFHAGHELALHDAINYCYWTNTSPPKWVMEELARRSWAQTGGEKPKRKKGRYASPLVEQRQLVEDAYRFEVVNRLRRDHRLTLVQAFEEAVLECGKTAEAIQKSYYRFKKGLKAGTLYLSRSYVGRGGDVRNSVEFGMRWSPYFFDPARAPKTPPVGRPCSSSRRRGA